MKPSLKPKINVQIKSVQQSVSFAEMLEQEPLKEPTSPLMPVSEIIVKSQENIKQTITEALSKIEKSESSDSKEESDEEDEQSLMQDLKKLEV